MRRFLLAAAALLAAVPVLAQAPGGAPASVAPLPFTPFVPPSVRFAGLAGPAAFEALFPDIRQRAGAAFFSNGVDDSYRALYANIRRRTIEESLPVLPPPAPEFDATRAIVTLEVSELAEVWVQGTKLTQPGATREFTTPVLDPTKVYPYEVRVRWQDGKLVQERTIKVPVAAGDRPRVLVLTPRIKG